MNTYDLAVLQHLLAAHDPAAREDLYRYGPASNAPCATGSEHVSPTRRCITLRLPSHLRAALY